MLRRPARGEGALIGLLIAAGVTCGAAFAGAVDASAGAECAPHVLEDDGVFPAELLARGWSGDPTDGLEALYPPGCLTP